MAVVLPTYNIVQHLCKQPFPSLSLLSMISTQQRGPHGRKGLSLTSWTTWKGVHFRFLTKLFISWISSKNVHTTMNHGSNTMPTTWVWIKDETQMTVSRGIQPNITKTLVKTIVSSLPERSTRMSFSMDLRNFLHRLQRWIEIMLDSANHSVKIS